MKNKKIIFLIIIVLLILAILCFFFVNKGKVKKIGNNSSSQEIVDYILNISSYETTINVEVTSNKTTNKYVIKQQYISPNIETQEVIEPSNIEGVKIIKNGNDLKLENTDLNLQNVYNNYEGLAENCLDLSNFIKCYKENEISNYEENENEIIMCTQDDDNKYTQNRKLYISRETGKPTKMEVTDINKNITVYIVYNEVKINSLNEENVLAFRLNDDKKDM